MKARVLITRRWPQDVERALKDLFDVTLNGTDAALSADQLFRAMSAYDAVCPCVTDRISSDLLCSGDRRVKIIAGYGVGIEHIDIQAARQNGIVVTNTPDVLTDATADLAMTLLLMVARRTGEGERQVRQGRWQGWFPTHLMGTMVSGKTLGIVGMGRIGLAVARRASQGFGMKVLYHNRKSLLRDTEAKVGAAYCEDIESLLRQSDFVSLHCPSLPETRHLLDAKKLQLMKPSACLVNTARGNIVDEEALIKALQEEQIAGAGLDVYEREPAVPPALTGMENVVLLPHLGSATVETRTAMGLRVVENLQAFFSGVEPRDRVA